MVAPSQASCETNRRLHSDWEAFFPLPALGRDLPDLLPVMVDGVRMLYPSSLVLVVVGDHDATEPPTPPASPGLSAGDLQAAHESHLLASQLLQGLHMEMPATAKR